MIIDMKILKIFASKFLGFTFGVNVNILAKRFSFFYYLKSKPFCTIVLYHRKNGMITNQI